MLVKQQYKMHSLYADSFAVVHGATAIEAKVGIHKSEAEDTVKPDKQEQPEHSWQSTSISRAVVCLTEEGSRVCHSVQVVSHASHVERHSNCYASHA